MCAAEPLIDVRLISGPVAVEPVQPFPAAAGAECVFLGRTREDHHAEHGKLLRLFYEAYEPMAMASMRGLATEAVERFGCFAVRIHHAVGEVLIGEASVLVQVACGHRAAAFEACRMVIDRLKAEAPIWKREVWEDGTTWSQSATAVSMEQSKREDG